MSREKLLLHPKTLLGQHINDATSAAFMHGIHIHTVSKDGVEVPQTEDAIPEKRFNVELVNDRVVGVGFDAEKFRVE